MLQDVFMKCYILWHEWLSNFDKCGINSMIQICASMLCVPGPEVPYRTDRLSAPGWRFLCGTDKLSIPSPEVPLWNWQVMYPAGGSLWNWQVWNVILRIQTVSANWYMIMYELWFLYISPKQEYEHELIFYMNWIWDIIHLPLYSVIIHWVSAHPLYNVCRWASAWPGLSCCLEVLCCRPPFVPREEVPVPVKSCGHVLWTLSVSILFHFCGLRSLRHLLYYKTCCVRSYVMYAGCF